MGKEIQTKLRVRAVDRRTGFFRREQITPQEGKPTAYILDRQGLGLPGAVHGSERKAIADVRAQLRTAYGPDIRIKTERVKVAQDGQVMTKEVRGKVVEEVKQVNDKKVDRYERKEAERARREEAKRRAETLRVQKAEAAKKRAEDERQARKLAEQQKAEKRNLQEAVRQEARKKAKETKKLRKAAQKIVSATLSKTWDRAKEFESANMDAQARQGEPNGSGFTMGFARFLMEPRHHVKDTFLVNRSEAALTADLKKSLIVIRDNGMDPENKRHGAFEWAADALKAEAETPVGLGMKWLMKKFPLVNAGVNAAVLINQLSSSDLSVNKVSQGINGVISTVIPLWAFASDAPTYSASADRQQDRIVYSKMYGAEEILGLNSADNRELAAYQRKVATSLVTALEQEPSHLSVKSHELGTALQRAARPLVNFEQKVVETGKKFGLDVHKVAGSVLSEVTKGSDTALNYSHILGALDTLKAAANQELNRPQSLLSYTVNLKDVASGMAAEETLRVEALEAKKPSIFKRKERKTHKKELKAARLAQAKWVQAGKIADEVLRVYQKASQLAHPAA